MINIQFIFYTIIAIIILHLILYFFNIDFFELFEKKPIIHKNNQEIKDNITDLEKSLEELKEITTQ